MKTKRKKLAGIILIIALIAGAVALRRYRKQEQESVKNAELPPWALRVVPVVQKPVFQSFPVLAKVLTSEELTISGRLQGEILSMGPREGQVVKKGEVIASIDTREIDQEILAQNAKLSGAIADQVNKDELFARYKKVVKTGGISPSSVDGARAASLAAKHTVESINRLIEGLEIRRSYAKIAAPADGTIAARLAEPGNLCTSFHPLYRITVTGGARVQVSLPQKIFTRIKAGTELFLDCRGETRKITLSRVFPTLDPRALGRAEADIENAPFGLQSGSRIPGRVILDQRKNALFLPHSAVLLSANDSEKGVVFVVTQSEKVKHLKRIPIVIDLNTAEGLAVKGNLKPGDLAVLAHDAVLLQLSDGDLVSTISDES